MGRIYLKAAIPRVGLGGCADCREELEEEIGVRDVSGAARFLGLCERGTPLIDSCEGALEILERDVSVGGLVDIRLDRLTDGDAE